MYKEKRARKLSLFVSFFLPIIIAALLTACGAGGGGGGKTESNTANQESTGIGPNGGTVTSSDGKAKVVIPAGVLTETTNITVASVSNQPSGNIGTAFEFGPDGTTFSQPITISVTYDEASLPSGVNESDLILGTVINNKWEALSNSTVDTAANVISGTTTHLSIYGMLAISSGVTAPSSPTGVTATAADGQATIVWDPVTGATSYNLYMASQSGVTKSNYNTLSNGMMHSNVTSPYIHTGLTNGTTYYFVVTAVNADGESAESSEVSTTPATSVIIPNAPGNLQTTAVSSSQINLAWTDNSANEDGFKIERNTGASGSYSQIATVLTGIKNYSDTTGLTANTAYCYQVRAFNSAGDSGYSNESCTNTLPTATAPSAPTGVVATAGDGQVTITWNSVVGATSYNLYMASQSGVRKSNYSTLADGMKHTSITSPFIHTGLTNGKAYYFVVTASNATGEGVESIEVVADVTPPTVSSTSPANSATNVAVNTAITATFSETMDASTVTTATFSLNNGVTGTVTYTGTTATFTPSGNLAYSTIYTATISTGVKDSAGNAMATNYTWTFTTGTATAAPGANFEMPDTNQTTSYTTTFGEDNDYTINPPSYADNANGTITDNVTGLIWQKQDDGVAKTWAAAITYCDTLVLGGQTDWRLPSRIELISIVDYGGSNLLINTTYFPGTISSSYWSSTADVGYASGGAWHVYFANGGTHGYGKTNTDYVRCVRGGQ